MFIRIHKTIIYIRALKLINIRLVKGCSLQYDRLAFSLILLKLAINTAIMSGLVESAYEDRLKLGRMRYCHAMYEMCRVLATFPDSCEVEFALKVVSIAAMLATEDTVRPAEDAIWAVSLPLS